MADHEARCRSACGAASEPVLTMVDPPDAVVITSGAGDEDKGARSHADGGIGFSNQQSTVWDAFSGRPDCSNDTTDFLEQLDAEPRLRSAAMLRSLGRLREELEAMPE